MSNAAGASATPVSHSSIPHRQEWLDSHREEAIDPDIPIIDAQHHLHEPPRDPYQFDDLLADTRVGHNVVATVYVENGASPRTDGPEHLRSVGEVEYVHPMAEKSATGNYGPARLCAGIVAGGRLDSGASKVREMLEASIRAGHGRLRGIRNRAAWHADRTVFAPNAARPRNLLMDSRFREGFALLAPLGLSFDTFLFHTQIGELADLARAFPTTTIVLNHVGTPVMIGPYAQQRDAAFREWSAAMRSLAPCPNVHVKLGGFGMRFLGFGFESAPKPPSSEQLAVACKPFVDTTIQAFGPGRCMFESNFPVDRLAYSYGVVWNAFKRLASGYSAEEKRQLFSGTAAKVYRLELPAVKAAR